MAHVYIRVTRDKYRLPVAIADSAEELARIVKGDVRAIYRSVKREKGVYERVEIADLEEEE